MVFSKLNDFVPLFFFPVLFNFLNFFFSCRFAIKKGCSGKCFLKVSLLDNKMRELPGEKPFLAQRQVAQSDGSWERLGHVFDSYPSGLRFIRFEDVLDYQKTYDQGYHLKACGATVKFSTGE